MTRERMRAILDGDDPAWGRSVAFLLQALIVLSAISVAVETVPGLPPWFIRALLIEELIIVAIFSVEYVLRVVCARRPLRYVTSVYGIIDLVAIAPTILLLGYDLRSLRVIRALRVLRLLKLVRYVRAFDRLAHAVRSIVDELVVFGLIAGVLIYLCATAIYLFEHDAQPEAFASIPHAMWWAVVTFTTVGYGDVYPITAGGRIFTSVILVLALAVVAVPTGLIATALSEERRAHKGEDDW